MNKKTKIKARTKKEKSIIGKMDRANCIREKLNSCFENGSVDKDDNETILDWACLSIPQEILVYLLEKIKYKKFQK